jgi:type VI secretion system secreted protein Hcp
MAIAAIYLKMAGVTGESLVRGHVGEIDVVSWDWGVQSAPYSLSDGSPGGASSFNALNIVKRVDRATPTLFKFCDEHKLVSSATLTVSKAGGSDALEYVTIEMARLRIIRVDVRTEESELTEHVTLSCETMTFNYTPQGSDGVQASAPISFNATHPANQ